MSGYFGFRSCRFEAAIPRLRGVWPRISMVPATRDLCLLIFVAVDVVLVLMFCSGGCVNADAAVVVLLVVLLLRVLTLLLLCCCS